MCLILFDHNHHPTYRLALAANRDEFLDRPTAPATFWRDQPDVLGGRDLKAGGTWLAIHRTGRWAAVTNVREPGRSRPDARSRGDLVTGFVRGVASPETYLKNLDGQAYNGFNLLVGDGDHLWYLGNREGAPRRVAPGVHGLSNAALDTPWPKVVTGREALRSVLHAPEAGHVEGLFKVLQDEEPAPDPALPDTGVGLDMERSLSPRRIRMDRYGTRSSSIVLIRHDGGVVFAERTYPPAGQSETRRFIFNLDHS